jgi:hypothetical protein
LSANAFRTNKYNIDSIDDSYIKEDFATRWKECPVLVNDYSLSIGDL